MVFSLIVNKSIVNKKKKKVNDREHFSKKAREGKYNVLISHDHAKSNDYSNYVLQEYFLQEREQGGESNDEWTKNHEKINEVNW